MIEWFNIASSRDFIGYLIMAMLIGYIASWSINSILERWNSRKSMKINPEDKKSVAQCDQEAR
jgi:preprotein translocase subunit SecF